MATEIERKYVVSDQAALQTLLDTLQGQTFSQGYLSTDKECTARVRLIEPDGVAKITIKGLGDGISRPEFEYDIPMVDAREIFAMCKTSLTKTRFCYPYEGHIFEIDVFHGRHEGLILVEVEISDVNEEIMLPPWIGEEVSNRSEYTNAALSQ